MKSNEEYLDELFRAMDSNNIGGSNDTAERETEDADIFASNKTEPVSQQDEAESVIDPDDLSAASLEQLMAEIQESAMEFEEDDFLSDDFMSEESIEDLLNAAKTGTTQAEMSSEGNEEFSAVNFQDDAELNDIQQLFDMAESGEIVEESEAPAEEEQVFSMEDLDSLLEGDTQASTEEASKKKEKKTNKKSGEEKKSGLGKLVSLLFEEEPEDMEPQEAGDLNLSDENKEILTQLDKEDREKKKPKPKKEKKKKEKGKKKKGEEIGEEEENSKKKNKKAVKPKKEKKPKAEKTQKEQVPTRPEKLLPKKKVIVTSILAASILIAILFLEFLLPPMMVLTQARASYSQKDYEAAYQSYYGERLSQGDEERFQTSRAVMKMQTNLDHYTNFMKMGDELKALHYLLEGVHVKDSVYSLAQSYDASAEVEAVYSSILVLLSTNYGLSETAAVELVNEKDDFVYTKKLQAIIGGTVYTESPVILTGNEGTATEAAEVLSKDTGVLTGETDTLEEVIGNTEVLPEENSQQTTEALTENLQEEMPQ